MDWKSLRTPLSLPGLRQAVCTRVSYLPTRPNQRKRKPDVHFYATSLPPHRASLRRLMAMIRGHWGIENKLHHPKDRTWQEDRHWLASRRGAEALAMLRTLGMDLMRRARLPGLDPKAHFPERIEHFQRYPKRAVGLVVRATRL